MAYIGSKPADKALTSDDITDGIISTVKIANDAVDASKLDETDDYAFTGTITGAGEANTPIFHAYNSTAQGALNTSTWSTVTLGSEKYDPQSTFASNQFSPSSTGYYYLEGSATCNDIGASTDQFRLRIYNATQSSVIQTSTSGGASGGSLVRLVVSSIVNVTDVDDNYELQYWQNAGGLRYLQGDTDSSTYFLGYKLSS